mmetsp:Transcript_5834/g.14499  ORF Transcript_5834/g.14499 Transcript_5834/m.14499 type:complete len:405 (-) Transcript_5834:1168-2382(-)
MLSRRVMTRRVWTWKVCQSTVRWLPPSLCYMHLLLPCQPLIGRPGLCSRQAPSGATAVWAHPCHQQLLLTRLAVRGSQTSAQLLRRRQRGTLRAARAQLPPLLRRSCQPQTLRQPAMAQMQVLVDGCHSVMMMVARPLAHLLHSWHLLQLLRPQQQPRLGWSTWPPLPTCMVSRVVRQLRAPPPPWRLSSPPVGCPHPPPTRSCTGLPPAAAAAPPCRESSLMPTLPQRPGLLPIRPCPRHLRTRSCTRVAGRQRSSAPDWPTSATTATERQRPRCSTRPLCAPCSHRPRSRRHLQLPWTCQLRLQWQAVHMVRCAWSCPHRPATRRRWRWRVWRAPLLQLHHLSSQWLLQQRLLLPCCLWSTRHRPMLGLLVQQWAPQLLRAAQLSQPQERRAPPHQCPHASH